MLLCILVSRERTGTTAYLATVQNAQISMGFLDPWEHSSLPLLKRVQAGISRIRLQQGKRSSCTRSPITMHILGRMREALVASSDTNKVVVWAVAYTASGFSAWGNYYQSTKLYGSQYCPDTRQVAQCCFPQVY